MLRYFNATFTETTSIPCTSLYRFDPKSLALGFWVGVLLLIMTIVPLIMGPLVRHQRATMVEDVTLER
jgi:hypothetical protein